MTEDEKIFEIDKIGLRLSQFIIAVNGALIAYAMKQIEDVTLSLNLIPVALAILFWAISFYSGVTSLRKLISTRILGVFKQREEVKTHHQLNNKANEMLKNIGDLTNKLNNRMFLFLYAGSVCFIIWQGWEMYQRTRL